MSDAADLIMRASVQGGRQAVKDLNDIAAAAPRAEKATEDLATSNTRLAQELKRADVAMAVQHAAMGRTNVVNLAAARNAKLASHEMLNLSRQVADLGTMAAMGASPMMILASQGAQIADIFGVAAGRGVTLKDVLGQVTASVVAGIAKFGPFVGMIGMVGAASWLAVDALMNMNKASAAVTKSTEDASDAFGAYVKAADIAERYTGKLRDMLNEDAEAARRNAFEKRALAEANLKAARSALVSAQAQMAGALTAGEGTDEGFAGALRASRAEANIKALQKALRELDIEQMKLDQGRAKGAQQYIAGLRQQAEEIGKTRGQAIMLDAARRAAEPNNKAYAGDIMAAAKAAAAAADAEDRRRASIRGARSESSAAARAAREAERADREAFRAMAETAEYGARELQPVLKKINEEMLFRAERARSAFIAEAAWGASQVQQLLKVADALSEVERSMSLQEERLSVEASLYGLSNRERAIAIAQYEELVALKRQLGEGFDGDDPRITSAIQRAGGIAGAEFDQQSVDRFSSQFGAAFSNGVRAALEGNLGSFLKQTFMGLFENTLGKIAKKVAASFATKTATSAVTGAAGSAAGGAIAGALAGGGAALGAGALAGGAAAAGGIGVAAGSTTAILAGSGTAAAAGGGGLLAGAAALASNPIGWAIGGLLLVGGLVGLLSGGKSKAKKAAEEAYQREQERVAKQHQEAQEYSIRLMESQGRYEAALNIQRELEISKLDAANQAMARQVHASEDAQERAQKMAQLDAMIATNQGNALGALSIQRQAELNTMRESHRAIQLAIYAQEDVATAQQAVETARSNLSAAYEREKGAIEATSDRFKALADGLKAVSQELDSVLGITRGASGAASFRALAGRARLGDEQALSDLPAAAREQVEWIKKQARTDLEMRQGIAGVRYEVNQAEATATRQVDIAARQLSALDASVAGLGMVNDSVLSVADAIAGLNGAIGQLAAAQAAAASAVAGASGGGGGSGAASGPPDYGAYVDSYGDLSAYYDANAAQLAVMGYGSKSAYGQFHYPTYGAGEGRTIPGFASGGLHAGGLRLVGENGPELEATGPARIYDAEQTAQMLGGGGNASVVAAIGELRAEVARLRQDATRTANASERSQKVLEGAAKGNLPLTTQAA